MAGSVCSDVGAYFQELSRQLARVDQGAVTRFADALYDAWLHERRVYTFGNGGSAYTASHMVTDLVKTAMVDGQRRLQAFSLVDNVGLTTALGNDVGYEETFRFPLASWARRGDVAVAISCSGNSPNLLRACDWAKEHGLTVIALTGFAGGKAKAAASVHVNVPSENYGVIEDLHLSIGHVVAQMLKCRIEAGLRSLADPRRS